MLPLSLFPPVPRPDGLMIALAFGFPYVLVVIMPYVGARVVYSLGTEVTRARELGSYRLEHRLGAGGMGDARACAAFGKHVILDAEPRR
jgi:hypothetical protein